MLAVRWYLQYELSHRVVEELRDRRVFEIDHVFNVPA